MTDSSSFPPVDPHISELPPGVLEAALEAHDRTAEELDIWWGAEPTFTDRHSEAAEWLCEALGKDKQARARKFLRLLSERKPGAAVLRPVGRKYAAEPEPRWCFGLYARRDGEPVWAGPPDRLQDDSPGPRGERGAPLTRVVPEQLLEPLVEQLRSLGWWAAPVGMGEGSCRLLCRPDGQPASTDCDADPRLRRPSVHDGRQACEVLVDPLAVEGSLLLILHAGAGAPANDLWVELPAIASVAVFHSLLTALGAAATELAVGGLGLRGFPPPVDRSVAWTTLSADPAVLEVNQAPEPNLSAFHRENRLLFELASQVGLSPYRLQYDGTVSDSGGGGQMTAGGPTLSNSPFFVAPKLLPRLVRYLVAHPSLSYWFATQYVGGSSQSPRPDEGNRQSFLELQVALEELARFEAPTPETLWGSLHHFLSDSSGNPHRSELNIEKLFNPHLAGRGKLGLVEFRALSMPRSPEVSCARAVLFRSLLLMLAREDRVAELKDWGDELHDRFALPFYLRRDLELVLRDLEAAGLGLRPELAALLDERQGAELGIARVGGYELSVQRGLEFWPLVGDVASQESGGSRMVDASTCRLQVLLQGPAVAKALRASTPPVLTANGWTVPLRSEMGPRGPVLVLGLRYRSFMPWTGLHPTMGASKNVVLTLRLPDGKALRLRVFAWRPDGEAYPGLPQSLADAAARREERIVVEALRASELKAASAPPARAVSPHCLDLRRVR